MQLNEKDSHHAAAVLRLRVGDRVEIIVESTGAIFLGAIRQHTEPVTVEIQELVARRESVRADPRGKLHLIIASIKPALEELVVEKAVELGVASISLFAGDRSNRAPAADRVSARLERLGRVAEAAMKQSGTSRRPALAFHSTLREALEELQGAEKGRLVFVAPQISGASDPEPTDIKSLFSAPRHEYEDLAEVPAPPLEVIAEDVDFHILIGPEGGFSSDELALARTYLFRAVSLGSSVLRAETAAIVACGIVQTMRP